jgi:hypothetical protein
MSDQFPQATSNVPAAYAFPPGTPEQVPDDFDAEAAKRELAELRASQAGQLTPEEVAEFRQLRAEKKAHDERTAAETAAAAAKLQPNRHHVHLADGSVVEGSTIETHYADSFGQLHHVTGAFPKPEFVVFAPVGG